MIEKEKTTLNKIIEDRLIFFVEILIVFFGAFFLIFIANVIISSLINETSVFYGPLYYLSKAIVIFISIPLFLLLASSILQNQTKEKRTTTKVNPSLGHLRLYKISLKNLKFQVLYGILLLFLLFIPLDFFTYLFIPQMIKYQADSLSSEPTGIYFTQSYGIFLISAIIIHISVALIEESIARGLIAKRGSEYFNKMSAVIISSLYFGMGHLVYFFFNPISASYSIWFSIIWFMQAFFIGIVLSLFIIKKKWIFPLIFAHALNNIISAHTIWNYMQGNGFFMNTIFLYIPLLIISLILLIWQFSNIKTSLISGINDLISYFQPDTKLIESNKEMIFRILFDVIIGLMVFGIGLLVL